MKETCMEGVAVRHGLGSSALASNDRCVVSVTSEEGVSWVLNSESISSGLLVSLLDVIGEMSCPHSREGHDEPAES